MRDSRATCSAVLLFLLFAPLSLAHASPLDKYKPRTTEGKRYYKLGAKFIALKKFKLAIQAYKDGYLADDAPIFLYNIATTYRSIGELQESIDYYKRFLMFARDPHPAVKSGINKLINQLRTEIQKRERDARARRTPKLKPLPPQMKPTTTSRTSVAEPRKGKATVIHDKPTKPLGCAVLVPTRPGNAQELAERYWEWDGDGQAWWQIIKGTAEYSAIAMFEDHGESTTADDMAQELSKKFDKPVYALDLDFEEEHPLFGVNVFQGGDLGESLAKFQNPDKKFPDYDEDDKDGEDFDELAEYTDPFEFAAEQGVDIKWWVPEPHEVGSEVCVVADATPEQLRRVYGDEDVTYKQTPIGVLCFGELGTLAVDFAYEFHGPVYAVLFRPGDDRFSVTVYSKKGEQAEEFLSNRRGERIQPANDPPADNVLGETLPQKILERLHIPPEVLSLDMKPKYTMS